MSVAQPMKGQTLGKSKWRAPRVHQLNATDKPEQYWYPVFDGDSSQEKSRRI